MNFLPATKPISLALLLATAVAVSAVSSFSEPALAGGDAGGSDETTISVRTSTDGSPTVIHVPELELGESRSFTSDSGKPIVISRSQEGLRLKVGEKETLISDHPGNDGESIIVRGSGDGGTKKIIVMNDDGPGDASPGKRTKVILAGPGNAYSFRTGSKESRPRTSTEVLKGRNLRTLDALDAKTRQAVLATLDELMTDGVFIAPMPDLDEPGEDGVQIRVERKRVRR